MLILVALPCGGLHRCHYLLKRKSTLFTGAYDRQTPEHRLSIYVLKYELIDLSNLGLSLFYALGRMSRYSGSLLLLLNVLGLSCVLRDVWYVLRGYLLHRGLLVNDRELLIGRPWLRSKMGRSCGYKLVVSGEGSCSVAILTPIVDKHWKGFLLQCCHCLIQDLGKRRLPVGRLAELVWREIIPLRLIILILRHPLAGCFVLSALCTVHS